MGWKPKIELRQGLKDAYTWFKENNKNTYAN
jgi:nucleoside-diphosphate-sugar epimerase